MCLGIPGHVVAFVDNTAGQLALIDVMGARRNVNIGMLDEGSLSVGDWVLIHMGFAVEAIDPPGAERAVQGLELMGQPRAPNESSSIGPTGSGRANSASP